MWGNSSQGIYFYFCLPEVIAVQTVHVLEKKSIVFRIVNRIFWSKYTECIFVSREYTTSHTRLNGSNGMTGRKGLSYQNKNTSTGIDTYG